MTFSIRVEGLQPLIQRFSRAPQIANQVVRARMDGLGRRIKFIMRQSIKPNRYTGAIEESVEYAVGDKRVEIGPTAKRGRFDAGLLLEMGTGPIPNLPFAAIAKWAEFRGVPAGAVWWKIKTKGVTPHPFLQRTADRGDTQVAVRNTAAGIAEDLTARIMKDAP